MALVMASMLLLGGAVSAARHRDPVVRPAAVRHPVPERAGKRPPLPPPVMPPPQVMPPPATPPPPPSYARDWLTSIDGTLHTSVGTYHDCSGSQTLTHAAAAIDLCMQGRAYFVGHNPGVFTPLLHLDVGDLLMWYDHAGGAHRLQIVMVRIWRGGAVLPVVRPGIAAQFQTCIDLAGRTRRVLDAVPA
jgi:hypothetical protein